MLGEEEEGRISLQGGRRGVQRGGPSRWLLAVLMPMLVAAWLSFYCEASSPAACHDQGFPSPVSSCRRIGRWDSSPSPLLRLRGAGERGRGHDVIPRRRLVKGKRSTAPAGEGGGGGGGGSSLFPEGTQVPNPVGLFSSPPTSGIGLAIQGQGQQPVTMGQGQAMTSSATPFGQLGSFPAAAAGTAPAFQGGSTFGGLANPFGAPSSPPAPAVSGSPTAAAAAGGMGQPGGPGGFGNGLQIPATSMVFGGMQAGGGVNTQQGGMGFGISKPPHSFSFGAPSSASAQGTIVAGNQSSPFGIFGGAGAQVSQQTSPFGASALSTGGNQIPAGGARAGGDAGGFKFSFGGGASSEGDGAASSAGRPSSGGGDGGFKFGASTPSFGAGLLPGAAPPLGGETKSPQQATPFSFGPSSGAPFGGVSSISGQFPVSKPPFDLSQPSGMAGGFGGMGGTSASPFSLPSANATSPSATTMFGIPHSAAGQQSSFGLSGTEAGADSKQDYKGTFLGLSKGGSANFGFIRPSDGDGTDNVFVHGSNIPEGLEAGAQVQYSLALHEQPGAGGGSAGVGAGEERKQAVNVSFLPAGAGAGAGAGSSSTDAGTSAGGDAAGGREGVWNDKPPLSELFGGSVAGEWTCDTCMVSNQASADKCIACMSPAPAGAAAGTSGGQSSPGLAPAKPKFQFGSSAAAQSSATGAAPASNEQAQAQAPKFQFGTAAASDAFAASAGSQAAVTANLQFGTSSGSGTLGGKAVAGGDAASLKFQFGGAGSGAGVGAEGAKAEAGTAKFQFGSAQAATAAQLGAQNSAAPAPAPAVGSTAGGAPGIRFGSSSSSSSSSTSSSSESGDDGPIIFPRAKSGEADATPGGGAAPLPAFSFGVSSTAKATPVPAASFGENRPQSAATADHPGHMFGGVGSKGGRAIAALPSFARATPRLMGYSLVSSDLAATAAFLSDELGMRCVRHDVMSQTLDADGKGGWTRSLFKFSASSELSACVEVVSSPELDGLALAPDGVILTAISSRAHEEMARRGRSVVADGGVHASVPGSSCSVVVYPGMKGFEELADVGLQVPDVEESARFWSGVLGAEMVDRGAGSAVKATLRFGGLGCSISLRRGYPYEGHRCGRIIMAGTEEIVRCVSTLAEDGDCLVSPLMRLACPGNKTLITAVLKSPGGYTVAAVEKNAMLYLDAPQDTAMQRLAASSSSHSVSAARRRPMLDDAEEYVRKLLSRQPDPGSRLGHARFAVEWLPSGYLLDGVESRGSGIQISKGGTAGAGLEGESCVSISGIEGSLNVWRAEGCNEWEDEEFLYVDSEQRGLLLGVLRDMERDPGSFTDRQIMVPRAVYL